LSRLPILCLLVALLAVAGAEETAAPPPGDAEIRRQDDLALDQSRAQT
jgi:hypothetical protein